MPESTEPQALDLARIRAILAARRISHKRLAQVAGLSQHYTSAILCGRPCGELARIKLERGMDQLGVRLDREPAHAS